MSHAASAAGSATAVVVSEPAIGVAGDGDGDGDGEERQASYRETVSTWQATAVGRPWASPLNI